MAAGWVKLYRKLLEHPLWKEKRVFSRAEAWLDILMNANYEDKTKNGIKYRRGEWRISELKLCDRWGWTRKKVRCFLGTAQRTGMVTTEGTVQGTTIIVVNWDLYQGEGPTEGPTQGPTEGPAEGTQTKKQRKKTKEDNLYSADFEAFWSVYPRHKDRSAAFARWKTRLKEGVSINDLVQAAKNYAVECQTLATEERFIKHAATFLGPNRPFEDYLKPDWRPPALNNLERGQNNYGTYRQSVGPSQSQNRGPFDPSRVRKAGSD